MSKQLTHYIVTVSEKGSVLFLFFLVRSLSFFRQSGLGVQNPQRDQVLEVIPLRTFTAWLIAMRGENQNGCPFHGSRFSFQSQTRCVRVINLISTSIIRSGIADRMPR